MNNKGFTLIELLAVIVVLAIVMVLATTTVLPYMGTAREQAFKLEATNAVDSAGDAMELYYLGEVKFDSNAKSCINSTKACFSIEKLIDLGIYDADKNTFSGRVDVDITDPKKPVYTLYLKKNDEFRFVGLNHTNYDKVENINNANWSDDYNSCNCN